MSADVCYQTVCVTAGNCVFVQLFISWPWCWEGTTAIWAPPTFKVHYDRAPLKIRWSADLTGRSNVFPWLTSHFCWKQGKLLRTWIAALNTGHLFLLPNTQGQLYVFFSFFFFLPFLCVGNSSKHCVSIFQFIEILWTSLCPWFSAFFSCSN